MDVVTLGMAKADANKLPRQSALAAVTGRLRRGIEDVTLAVLGDSTGNDTDEWVRLTVATLAARYPAYTVTHRLWNDTNQNYDAATTIQTGTGSKTLAVYNASTPGKDAPYSTGRLPLQLPVAPHAVIINYAHNSNGADARTFTFPLIRSIRDLYPRATIAITAQNPRAATDADYANGLGRQQSMIDLATSEGLTLINVLHTFLGNPNYASQWLNVDGLHPNPAGSQVWAAEVAKHLGDSSALVPAAPPAVLSRVWVPASQLVVSDGTPTLAPVNAREPGWSLPDAATSGLCALVDIPSHWGSVDVYIEWTCATASGFTGANNAVRWELGTRSTGALSFTGVTSTTSPGGTSGYNISLATTGASNTGVAYSRLQNLHTAGYAPVGRPVALRLRRLGADGNDTLAEAAYLLGVYLVRAS